MRKLLEKYTLFWMGLATLIAFPLVAWVILFFLPDSFGLSFWGMQLAHIGLVVSALGVGIASSFNEERDVRMERGDEVVIQDYRFKFDGSTKVQGANFKADEGRFLVYQDDTFIADLKPQKRQYHSQMGNTMTEAAINPTLARDLFVAMGEPLENGAWAVRVQYKPFIRLIWLGAIFMALGGVLVIADKRYR